MKKQWTCTVEDRYCAKSAAQKIWWIWICCINCFGITHHSRFQMDLECNYKFWNKFADSGNTKISMEINLLFQCLTIILKHLLKSMIGHIKIVENFIQRSKLNLECSSKFLSKFAVNTSSEIQNTMEINILLLFNNFL